MQGRNTPRRGVSHREAVPDEAMMTQMSMDFNIPNGLNPDEISVLRLIQPGRANAISKDTIAAATGIHWRQVQEIIEHLIHEHDCNIGSSSGRPFGYYIITDPEEIDEVYNSLRRRGIKILCRAAKLKRISLEDVFGQGRMV